MNKTAKILLWIGIAIVIIIVIINVLPLFAKKTKGKVVPPTTTGGVKLGAPSAGGGNTGITAPGLNASLVLQQGSSGPEVKELQTLLATSYDPDITIDGIFGSATLAGLQFCGWTSPTITLAQAWPFFTATNTAGFLNFFNQLG